MAYEKHGMSLIVKTVTRLTLGFILIYGIYLSLSGHNSPGGGFAGGVIVALAFIHIMLAFGKEVALKRLHSQSLRVIISTSAIVFLLMVMTNFLLGRSAFLRVFRGEIIIPLCEMTVVGFGLFAIFIALILVSKSDQEQGIGR